MWIRSCWLLLLVALIPCLQALADAGQPAPQDKPPRTDLYGDPLPDGAVARLGAVPFRPGLGSIVAFAPDWKIAASGGRFPAGLAFWNPGTGKVIQRYAKHKAYQLAFSGDGKLLVTSFQDVCLVEVETGTTVLVARWESAGLLGTFEHQAVGSRHGQGTKALYLPHTGGRFSSVHTGWQDAGHVRS